MDWIALLVNVAKIAGGVLLVVICLMLAYRVIAPVLFRALSPLFGKFPSLIAQRYLYSKKERNAINVITMIAIVGTLVVTAALIITLSVFNGFQGLIQNRYGLFDPDIRMQPVKGRTMPLDTALLSQVRQTPGVEWATPVVENKAIITFGDKQQLVSVKGLMPDHPRVKDLKPIVYEGSYSFMRSDSVPQAVLGGTVAYYLTSKHTEVNKRATLWAALDEADPIKNPQAAIDSEKVQVAGYFKTTMEYDAEYVLVSYALAEKLLHYEGLCTSLEVRLRPGAEEAEVKQKLAALAGAEWQVLTLYEQHQSLFMVMKNEKFVAYLILTLMLIITGVNIVGSLSMIVVEKKRDIAILKSFGATRSHIRKAFLLEGLMVGGTGGLAGMLAAFIFGIAQENFGVLRVNGGETFQEIPFFPHEMHGLDYAFIFLTVFAFSLLAAWYPAVKAAEGSIAGSLRK